MDRLIFTAMSGASRSLSQQQIHANNLANVNTQGFRSDLDNAISQQVNGEDMPRVIWRCLLRAAWI